MITDFDLLDRVLAEIERAVPMAILHREPDVARHAVDSDVDICVAFDPHSVAAAVVPSLRREGILAVLVFHYDRGAWSIFFADERGRGGAQVDLLHDPSGVARYGAKTAALLAKTQQGVRWPRTDALDEALYVLRKRQVKGDAVRTARARERAVAFGGAEALKRADEIFSPRAASDVAATLSKKHVRARGTPSLWRSRAWRPSRIVRRSGHWAHLEPCAGAVNAETIVRHMSRIVDARVVTANPQSLLGRLWRPNLLVSSGSRVGWLRPDTLLGAAGGLVTTEDCVGELVLSMHRRVCTTFGFPEKERTA